MKEEKDIDNIFKKRLKERKFELKEQYMAHMETQLDAFDRKKRKRKAFWWTLSLFLLLGSSSYFLTQKNRFQNSTEEGLNIANRESSIKGKHKDNHINKKQQEKELVMPNQKKETASQLVEETEVLKKNMLESREKRKNKNKALLIKERKQDLAIKEIKKTAKENLIPVKLEKKIDQKESLIEDSDKYIPVKKDILSTDNKNKPPKNTVSIENKKRNTQKETTDPKDNSENSMEYLIPDEDLLMNQPKTLQLVEDTILEDVILAKKPEEIRENSFNKMALGFVFSPNYTFLSPDAEAPFSNSPKFGISTGLGVIYKPTKRLAIEGGLKYTNKGGIVKSKTINERWVYDSTLVTGVTGPTTFVIDSILVSTLTQLEENTSYNYIAIPLRINYIIGSKKVKPFIAAGITTNLFLQQKVVITVKTENNVVSKKTVTENPEDVSRINFSMNIGIGIDYNLNKHFNLRIAPTYSRSLTPIVSNAPTKQYFNSFEGNIGLYYKW